MKAIAAVICALAMLVGCAQDTAQNQEQRTKQEKEQGYVNLSAMPVIADYALPFCEKKYCIEVEIFGFNSQDEWFNQWVAQQSADLIRQQLGLKQKLSLQAAVDAFVNASDDWHAQSENANAAPWRLHIQPRIAMQRDAITLLQLQAEYRLGETVLPNRDYYFVLDRKQQQQRRLYDVIIPQHRVAFMDFIQSQYVAWQQGLSAQDKAQLPEKLYWANQDWFFDTEGIAVYYRALDYGINNAPDLTIYLSAEQAQQWVQPETLKQLKLADFS